MRRAVFAAAVTTACLGSGVALAHQTSFDLRGDVDYQRTGNGDVFTGEVRSEKPACVPDRRVKLKRERDGADPTVGSDLTNEAGRWRIDNGFLKQGRYYVKVLSRDIGPQGHDHVCVGGRSEDSFRVDPPPSQRSVGR